MFRNVLWTVPLTLFKSFDSGEAVPSIVPASWGLGVGDRVEYECGQTIGGIAEVVSIKPSGTPGMECEFRKVA